MGREPFTTPLFVITGGRLLPSRGLHVLQPFLLPASLKTQNSRTVTSRVPWLQQLPGSAARPAPTKQYPHHGAPAQDCCGLLCCPSLSPGSLWRGFDLSICTFPITAGVQDAPWENWRKNLVVRKLHTVSGKQGLERGPAVTVPVFWVASGLMSVTTNCWPLRQAHYSQHYTCRQIHHLPSAHDAWG